ncbi:hypothetical protein L2E82_31463 [Cichorium intybus]|uniref:Uncharacterized protein n=1 Tax=Cichorium intybus TaxID=13427 RepID=A0ACB9D331_CICIN|nr:hypothetical protein L2E82_31463 [Cichorium intybus]
MQEVAVNNYRAFISAADALVSICHEVSSIDIHLESLEHFLPLASVSQQPYISELLSFTLDRLHKEPELLRVDAERIRRQMQEVAVNNYRAFISAAEALVSIRHEVSSIDKHLESLKLNEGSTLRLRSHEPLPNLYLISTSNS